MLLSAFAFQAVEAERRARLAERSSRLQDEARERAQLLHGVFQGPARLVHAKVASLPAESPQEVVGPLNQLVESQPLFKGFFVLNRAGKRVYPASQPGTAPAEPALSATGQVGGLMGSALTARQRVTLASELAPQSPAAAKQVLQQVVKSTRSRQARITALYDLGLLYEGSELLGSGGDGPSADLLNARDTYTALAGYPIHLTDLRGRPAPAFGRFRLAMIHLAVPGPHKQQLGKLIDELGASALLLPAETVAHLSARAAFLLDDPSAVTRARALASRRRREERRYDSLEGLFREVLQAALREGKALPRLSAPDLEGAREPSSGVAFLKRRVAKDYELLTYVLLRPESDEPSGLVAIQWDMRALRTAFARQLTSSLWLHKLVSWDPDPEADGEVGRARLHAPFDHLAVEVRARPEPLGKDTPGLDLPRETLQLWAIALSVTGILMGVVVTTRTIRKESKAAQLKSDFVSNVTHELKTPLTSIRMFLETLLLGRVKDEAETRECLEIMDRETQRLTRLIEQLLVFSRIESRKWRVRFSSEDPAALVREAIRVLADQLHTTPDELGIQVVAVQDLPKLPVDRFAVVEALLNLLHNAWKYSPNPDREVRVVITDRRREMEIAVEDNGMGVPLRDRRRIFVKFERGSNAEKSRVEGTGIGLTLATEIARAHGGRVRYSARKPRGSRFSIFLPK